MTAPRQIAVMPCPQCAQDMTQRRVGDAVIDECPGCRGIWFDAGEIEDVKDALLPDLRWLDVGFVRQRAEFAVSLDPLFCPRCREVALTAVQDRQSGTTIRFCTQCRGSWLTAADFRRLIDALAAEAEERDVSQHVRESLKQAAELLTGSGSLLSEWKDLVAVLRLLKYRVFVEHPKIESVVKGVQKSLPL